MSHHHHSAQCEALLSQLHDYIDGELEAALCAAIEAHLSCCDDCRVLVDTTQKTITLYRRQTPVELPAGALNRLRQALDDAGCRSEE
jgi:anti-sigma factor RsiW